MNHEDLEYSKELLYSEDNESTLSEIQEINKSSILHILTSNYNWNNGFDIPRAIMNNKCCDYGTGLLIFYLADGYRLLESRDTIANHPLKGWKEFIEEVYMKLIQNDFSTQSISYTPPLTKVQIFKLRKANPSIPEGVLSQSPGGKIDIPLL